MNRTLSIFLYFDGNCREATEFYARTFQAEVRDLMTYGEMPPDPDMPVAQADKDRIMYAGLPYGDIVLMFCDMPSESDFVVGNNFNPTLGTGCKDDFLRIFNALKEGGEVYMEPGKTFFSDFYGMVKDKYGVIWQLFLNAA
ncbi:MAG: VOC family protein [Clostridiales bacterium]|jgi:PhnB protein|nr:VOC family protein [Clostridiales bacterium]